MKKLLYCTTIVIILSSFSYSLAYQTVSTQRITPSDVRCNYHHSSVRHSYNMSRPNIRVYNGIYTPSVHVPAYKKRSFNGFEGNQFHRRSYYIPSYCTPGSAFHGGMHNPFCNQYYPYGSGFYTNF